MRKLPLALALASLVLGLPLGTSATAQTQTAADAPSRQTEPVVLTGERFPEWAVPADVALEAPHTEGLQCEGEGHETPGEGNCTHNRYEDPDFQSSDHISEEGVPIDRLLGYRWNGTDFEQIPFQVDEMAVRYLSNNNSGFAFYSETDQHTTYVFDREGFRWLGDRGADPGYESDPLAPCRAKPTSEVAEDPVKGLDTDDEVVFMYDDSGARAPADALLPPGVQDSYEVTLVDPFNQKTVFAYVMLAGPDGPGAAFDNSNGYVRYQRDAEGDDNLFLFSESSFENYGATAHGPVFDPATGTCGLYDYDNDPETPPVEVQRRPGDQATITTPRYRFRYDGRWLMTRLEVNADESADSNERFADLTAEPAYGPDLIDQWKARAFQQRPGGEMPCCGYEEEVNNWGGSSILMGELAGPVRVIRETWGADSGTNVVRREIFYRDDIRFGSFLRVHVIPPLDGIYAQWDYNAGIMERYYNPVIAPQQSDGVPIDGQDDERVGNSRVYFGRNGVAIKDPALPPVVIGNPDDVNCNDGPEVCNDVDSPDPTFSGVNQGANWEEVAGPHGTLVWRSRLTHVTPGGAQTVVAVPYYRDDSCFDDGTGSNPGPHLNPRNPDETDDRFNTFNGEPRECWTPEDGIPPAEGDPRFWQGSIGTHGVHLLLIAESDNAGGTVPLTEIDSEQRAVVLPGDPGNVGDRYGRAHEKPLVIATAAESRGTRPMEPEMRDSSLSLTLSNQGNKATATATLTDAEDGSGLPGRTIRFLVNGTEVATGTTDDSGTTTAEFKAKKGDTVEAVFDGDDSYNGSRAEATASH